jgi:hypothetical protein
MNPRHLLLTCAVGGLGLLGSGCHNGGLAGKSKSRQQNVLVIDDGFDPTVDRLQGRVAGLYTITCKTDSGSGGAEPATFEEAKAQALAQLKVKDDSCHITEGVTKKPDPLPTIAKYQKRFNDMIVANKLASDVFTEAEFNEISTALDSDLEKAHFHGTATSGTIAYDNPGVRLVLVEEILGDAGSAMSGFTCIQQTEINASVMLSSDPEVHQAIIDQPTSTEDEDLAAIIKKYDVGVINESFGTFTRQLLEQLQAMNNCAPVDLKPYFAVEAELAKARDVAHPLPDTLLVKSAGNEASNINAPEDAVLCGGSAGPRLAVGAYDLTGAVASFSNFGACVDVFAPGTAVITPLPHGWLFPLDGTSFSAPLVARFVSQDTTAFTTQGAHDRVLAAADANHQLAQAKFPRALFYDPRGMLGTQSLANARLLASNAQPRLLYSMRQLRKVLAGLHRGR